MIKFFQSVSNEFVSKVDKTWLKKFTDRKLCEVGLESKYSERFDENVYLLIIVVFPSSLMITMIYPIPSVNNFTAAIQKAV